MKIGVTVWHERISPVFDNARSLWIYALESDGLKFLENRSFGSALPEARAEELSSAGINVLICGAISMPYSHALESCGIQIVPFISGDVSTVLDAYVQNRLNQPHFFLPGCGCKRRYRFRGGHSEK